MDAAPFTLTFGVELEFIVRYDPADYQDELVAAEGITWPKGSSLSAYRKYGILVSLRMIRILNENEFPTNEYEPPESSQTDFSKWTVGTDMTISPVDISGKYAVEVKTPVLVWSRAALESIETLVKLLVSKFKLYTNWSCGLHVHVGNENRGFTVGTLKDFCSLIIVFENQLNSLHPVDRLRNGNAKSMSSVFKPIAPVRERLSIIDRLKTVEDVVCQFQRSGDRMMAFNFFNLLGGIKPIRTIEFRQHRGTLDPESITHWVMVACNLVEMSHSNKAGTRDLIKKHTCDTEYAVTDLFRDLKLYQLAKFYDPFVFQYESDDQAPADTVWEKIFAPRPPSEM